MLKGVVFSQRAIVALLAEVNENIKTETGGVFLGHRFGNIWYIVETVDPGINCILKQDYYENDDVYQTHLVNKINMLYEKKLEVLGIWHRHPGSFDVFSNVDDSTNKKHAAKHSDGAISALVNIDPDFRLSIYHVTSQPFAYRKVSAVMIGDCYFPPALQFYVSVEKYLKSINDSKKASINGIKICNKSGFSGEFSFALMLEKYLSDEKIRQNYEKDKKKSGGTDDEIEMLLEALHLDLLFFDEAGIKVSLSLSKSDKNGIEVKVDENGAFVSFLMFVCEKKAFFKYKDKVFEYFQGMFREACEYITLLGV